MSETRIICEGGCGFPRAFCCCEPTDAMQDDVLELLRALKLPDCARPASPHRVVQDEILPAVAALTAENERLDRAQRDHFTLREELRIACDTGMRLNLPAGQIVARIRDSLGADAARFAIRDRESRAALPSSRETTAPPADKTREIL